MIRAAVIGLGRWGRNHVRSVQGGEAPPSPHVRFVRAVVQTPEKSAEFAREHGLDLGTELDAVLAGFPDLASLSAERKGLAELAAARLLGV
jgi:predicted dehydrogenase